MKEVSSSKIQDNITSLPPLSKAKIFPPDPSSLTSNTPIWWLSSIQAATKKFPEGEKDTAATPLINFPLN